MSVFVDASALIAIVARESESLAMLDRLQVDSNRLCSAISVWETVAGLCRRYTFSVPGARARVDLFLNALGLRFVSIGQAECDLATEAYMHFGKGRHPAALNMGDCFAYACARTQQATLLFKGNDFAKTDIQSALP